MRTFLDRYLDDLIVPLAIILGAIVLGILVERLIGRFIYRFFERRNWPIGRRLIRAMNGVLTIWFGIAAFRSVLSELPFKPAAVPLAEKIAAAILLLSFAVLLGRVIVAFIRTYSNTSDGAVTSITLIENIVKGVIYIFGVLAVFRTFGVAVTPMLTALGVGGLAVALALQDTLSNFFAGVYIIISRALNLGDYIRLASGEEGTIQDIAWRVTTLRTPSNTLVIVPNNKFATSIITNYDRPEKYTGLRIPFTLDANSDIKAFEAMALEVGKQIATEVPQALNAAPAFDYVTINTNSVTVQLTVQITDYIHQDRVRNEVLRRVYEQMRANHVGKFGHFMSTPAEGIARPPLQKEEEL